MIQSVDLAAKFSAVVLRDRSGEVLGQFDSRELTPFQFVARIGRTARWAELTVVEDIPYGISNQAMVKPALRLQGSIMLACNASIDNLFFCAPATWMKDFDGVQRAPKGLTKSEADKYRIEMAAKHAAELGYQPPDLVQAYIDANPGKKILKKDTAPLEKSMTDYVSAFLMSEFVRKRSREQVTALQGFAPAYI